MTKFCEGLLVKFYKKDKLLEYNYMVTFNERKSNDSNYYNYFYCPNLYLKAPKNTDELFVIKYLDNTGAVVKSLNSGKEIETPLSFLDMEFFYDKIGMRMAIELNSRNSKILELETNIHNIIWRRVIKDDMIKALVDQKEELSSERKSRESLLSEINQLLLK